MDKFMLVLGQKIEDFFDWWADKTGLPTERYSWLGKEFSVNWPIVSFVLVLIFVMLLVLPGGLIY